MNEHDIVFRLKHPACEDITTLLRDAVVFINDLRLLATQHRDGRLDALEKLAALRGPSLDVDVWPVD
jgi:hypothetical protein